MIGKLFQVTIPPAVFDGADMIRVIDAKNYAPKEGEKNDLFLVCRVSKDGQFVNEQDIKMDDFCDLLTGGILIRPEPHIEAKILLTGNKV